MTATVTADLWGRAEQGLPVAASLLDGVIVG
jgi:hypothetical protein